MRRSIWDYKKVHMVGIKGVGMTALAEILQKNRFALTGSDVKEEFMTDEVLKRLGIGVADFHFRNTEGKDAIIHSNAYTPEHMELKAARDRGIPIFSYPEVVAELFNAHNGIAVAGSHGKTTTTAMLAHILKYAGTNATAIVGSKVRNWGSGAIAGTLGDPSIPFVLEADEYKDAFLHYRPKGAIITNIDWDHPDYFKTPEEYKSAFAKFVALLPEDGFLVINGEDNVLMEIASRALCDVLSVTKAGLEPFVLRLAGEHNVFNANLAYQAALKLGLDHSTATSALADFEGTARRMELVGERNGMIIYDDYAHHPTEIKATLAALKEMHPGKKIIAVFQPHTFSRTKALFNDFTSAFSDADIAILTDVYPSARERKEEYTHAVDMGAMERSIRERGNAAQFIRNTADVEQSVRDLLTPEAIVVTLGAGDIWQTAKGLTTKD